MIEYTNWLYGAAVSSEYLHELCITEKNPDILTAVACNKNTSIADLRLLSQNEDWYIRSKVASNPNTTPDILTYLSEDKEYVVRRTVAHNKRTPVEILEKLCNDEEDEVRMVAGFVILKHKNKEETKV